MGPVHPRATKMRTASYIGFFVMIGLGVGAFAWADSWWLTVLLIVVGLAVGWYSLGLYARAATAASQLARNFEANDEDLLRELGRGRAHEEVFLRAREQDE
jgi:hypothetical protein